MALKFETQDTNYTGVKDWVNNSEVKNVRIFTEDLPVDIDTIPFHPFLVQLKRKYAILTDIKVDTNHIEIKGQIKPPHVLKMSNTEIERGLRITLMGSTVEVLGILTPKT